MVINNANRRSTVNIEKSGKLMTLNRLAVYNTITVAIIWQNARNWNEGNCERTVIVGERKNRSFNDEKYRKVSSHSQVRSKSKRNSVRQPCQDFNQKESNFLRSKKLGLLKRNSAQDRLKKINLDVEIKKKVCDKIIKLKGSERSERCKTSEVLLKNFLPDETCLKYRSQNFSADARLKRIKLACKKKLDSESTHSSDFRVNSRLSSAPVQTSFSQNSDDIEKKLHLSDKLKKQVENQLLCSTAEEFFDANSISMDIDIDFIDCDKLNESKASDCLNKDSDFWSSVTESNLASINDAISKMREESSYLARYDNLSNDKIMNLAVPVGDLFVVVDTNIFLSHLNFIGRILKYGISAYRSPVIIAPWLVMQELDYLMKKDDLELSKRSRLANAFIYSCLKKKHPRFYGQSLLDFRENFENAVSIDDFILNYCLKFVSMDNNVVLLTDDINLCNKSLVNQLRVYTKAEFEKCFNAS